MKKEIRIFDSHQEADEHDLNEVRTLSGSERIQRALELMSTYYENSPRLERVYRVVKLKDMPISDGWRVGI